MFKVDLGNTKYKVYFQHVKDRSLWVLLCDSRGKRTKRRNGTFCHIAINGDDGEAPEVVSTGVSFLRPDEQCNHAMGNKVALQRALQNLFPDRKAEVDKRLVFWDAYNKMRGEKW